MSKEELPPGVIRKDQEGGKVLLFPFPQGTDFDTAQNAVILLARQGPRPPVHVNELRLMFISRIHRSAGDQLHLQMPQGMPPETLTNNLDALHKACAFVTEQRLTHAQVNAMMRGETEFPDIPGVEFPKRDK